MNRIKLMDKLLSELIAAGEVVERPASVVKELVENSIDAKSKRITVEIKDGGTTFIRVTDDGVGIEAQDVPTAFLRHATSKISTKDDLDSISTMGFRGEALAAVCAVSKVDIMTCTENAEYGVHYVIHASEEIEYTQTGCPRGTTVIVRDIFYNTPARLKFLKKNVTEANAVEQMLEKIALIHPEISFRFIRDGETKLMTPGDFNPISAIYSVYGKPFAETLIPIEYTYNSMKISGYVGKPEASKQNRSYQNFYVNSRYIRSSLCSAALEESCKGKTMVGKFPVCILNIELPFEAVDVNVHPAKTEIRFHNERDIFHLIYYAVKSALENTSDSVFSAERKDNSSENISIPIAKKPVYLSEKPTEGTQLKIRDESSKNKFVFKNTSSESSYITPDKDNVFNFLKSDKITDTKENKTNFFKKLTDIQDNIVKETSLAGGDDKTNSERENFYPTKPQEKAQNVVKDDNKPYDERNDIENDDIKHDDIKNDDIEHDDVALKFIGEAFATYILFESEDTLFFADKHAAHERILYEKIKSSYSDSQRQILLSPVCVSLSPNEYDTATENLKTLEEMGFLAEDFGSNMIVVREAPLWTPYTTIEDCVVEIVQKLLSYKKNLTPQRLENLFESIACRAAVKAGDFSSEKELEALLNILKSQRQLKNCPHGRPIFVEMKKRDIEKMFGRLG